MSFREYVFHFDEEGKVTRIPHTKWNRVRNGEELLQEHSNKSVYIAYAYMSLENRKPDYCPRIDGAIYYFDAAGRVILDKPYYFDLLQDLDELNGCVIDLLHRKKKAESANKYHWQLTSKQIQAVIDYIWPSIATGR
ncbi:MAG: hypothetical protein OEY29_10085 [Gammaproteobacteria bacterium]|nr:hypothetical protein [Gammaproteobacteria bacterium]